MPGGSWSQNIVLYASAASSLKAARIHRGINMTKMVIKPKKYANHTLIIIFIYNIKWIMELSS